MSAIAGESSRPATLLAMEPIMKASTAEPAVQASSSGRCNRHARPSGEPRAPAAGPRRSLSNPEPRSRRRRNVNATATLVPVAFTLRRRRDLGSGLLSDRRGPAAGALGSPLGLAWRLQRPLLLAWTAGSAVLAFMMGSIANNVAGLLDSPAMKDILQRLGGKQGLTDAFLAAVLGLVSTIIAAYGISAVGRLRTEESAGHAESVLATATPRIGWAASHWLLALAGVAWLMLVAGVATGMGHALAIGEPGQVLPITVAALARIPAAWVMVGLVVALWGVWPHATGLGWGAYAAFIVVGEFGQLWGVPQWVMDLSPFTHSPVLPGPCLLYTSPSPRD